MTAICGLWQIDGSRGAARDCARMQRALAIYGRDRSGRWDGGTIALGSELGIITPEDRLDRQPVVAGDERFRMVADIRLDNRPELASQLGLAPARAREAADSDFAILAWQRWGEAAIDRLIGDFALAVWDAKERKLILARDFMGSRPLFYRAENGRFAFASMAKGIHALPGVPLAPDLETLRDQLALLPMRGPRSHFAGIHRVEPGSIVALYADGRFDTRSWYSWRLPRRARFADDREAVTAVRETFDRAVRDRLRAIGPVGSHLSSGFDSAAVTATATRILAGEGRTLTAYTHVPPEGVALDEPASRRANEWPIAHEMADLYPNIDHVAVDSAGRPIGGDFSSEYYFNEIPVLNPCNAVWVNQIARLAGQRGQKVLLSGVMGNATISATGIERLAELLSAGNVLGWLREALACVRCGMPARSVWINRSLAPFVSPVIVAAWRRRRGTRVEKVSDYSALKPALAQSSAFLHHMRDLGFNPTYPPARDPRNTAIFLLRRYDPAPLFKGLLGAYGVEERDPTADRRLVELSLSLPSHFWLRGGRTKWLYRAAFADRVPAAIIDEPRRGYQGADWLTRLRASPRLFGSETRAMLANPCVGELLDVAALQALIERELPDEPSLAAIKTYRLKLLRGLGVAHFIHATTRPNDAGEP